MTQTPTEPTTTGPRSPLPAVLDLFSSIWLSVVLLSILFVYSSIGSAYPPFRQMRIFEMTEYEWFHYWPFNGLIALICINLTVATIRRIPFKPINYGVWMIHAGIIILALSSVWYFSTKIEGETLIQRRTVTVELDGAESVTFAAQPGRSAVIENDQRSYHVRVANIDPQWELLSGPDKGKRAYSVTLSISPQEPGAEPSNEPVAPMRSDEPLFMRQLIAGFPEYTEDIIRTNDHTQPMKRAKKLNPDGQPLVDTNIRASLSYSPAEYTYLVNSSALYLRELDDAGEPMTPWIERPIDDLPRYHDYVSSIEDVWLPNDRSELSPDPLSIRVPAVSEDDPLAGTPITVTDYLRYAMMDERRVMGGDELDPVVSLELSSEDGRSARYELSAFDPQRRSAENGRLLFKWVQSRDELEKLRDLPGSRLRIEIPAADYSEVVPIRQTLATNPDTGFTTIGDTGYSYRVEGVQNRLAINPNLVVSVAIVQVRTPDGEFTRLVYDEPDRNTDFPSDGMMTGHEEPMPLDDSISMTYLPDDRPAEVTIVGGPDPEQLRILRSTGDGTSLEPMEVGDTFAIGSGLTLRLWRYASHTQSVTRPSIVPRHNRDRNAASRRIFAMVRIDVPNAQAGATSTSWLPFHLFPFESKRTSVRRFSYNPQRLITEDGRTVELLFSRQRKPLPAAVVLDDFILTTHTGGFVNDSSIRNWTSAVRFAEEDQPNQQWGGMRKVSVNDPIEYSNYWFFQSQWDAPSPPRGPGDPGSPGLGFTVLGVGTRNGVNVMLFGTIVSVIGMLYAFYWKPVLRRRKMMKVQQELAGQRVKSESPNGELTEETAGESEPRPLEPVASSTTELRS